MTRRSTYTPHEAFITPARRRAELWRLPLSAILVFLIYLAPIAGASVYLSLEFSPSAAQTMRDSVVSGETPGAMLIMLYSFGGLAIATMTAVRLFHRRSAATLFGADAGAIWRNFRRVVLPLLALQLLVASLALGDPAIRPGLTFAAFLSYLPFALPGLLIQIGAEELLFRGYLQQQLAARFASPLVWMGLPSALFAWGHYAPEDFGAGAIALVLWAFAFGCFAADLTARTGNLGAALAFHAANNASAMFFIGLDGNLDGLALWSLHIDFTGDLTAPMVLAADFLTMLCSWLLARLALRC
jgi:membrane protease YdiL (CAAX protease family)